tara:strand:+ start:157 stop:693 length:537 start_codon:yes stop_codon:yes gene_type:complete
MQTKIYVSPDVNFPGKDEKNKDGSLKYPDKFPGFVPQSGTGRAAGDDVSTPYPFILKKGEKHLVDTGLIIKIPRGFCILVLPRSGLACKQDIIVPNSPGLIDGDYAGEEDYIKVMLRNTGDEDRSFEAGDRLCQFLYIPYMSPSYDQQDSPDFSGDNSRGGFGDSGIQRKASGFGRSS